MERLAGGYGSECVRVRQDLSIAEAQLRDYQARLGNLFLYDTYLAELTTLRDQLKVGLSGTMPEPRKDGEPSVSELSEGIKSLKSAHSIDATPQRDRQKHFSAAEPITARIRRRTESVPESDLVTESDAEPEIEGASMLGLTQNSSVAPPGSFRERMIQERQRKYDGASPP